MNKFELVVESALLDWKVFGYTVCGLVSGLVVLVMVGN
jgi:hypothetical protein